MARIHTYEEMEQINKVLARELESSRLREKSALLQMNTLQKVFRKNVHDFRNNLTGIVGNIALAKHYLDASHDSYSHLIDAEKAVSRGTEQVDQLLNTGGDAEQGR